MTKRALEQIKNAIGSRFCDVFTIMNEDGAGCPIQHIVNCANLDMALDEYEDFVEETESRK